MEHYFDEDLINEYCPEAECIPAMKIWKLPKGKEYLYPEKCDCGEYFGEIKKDGYWYEYEKTENYDYLFSRAASTVTGILTNKIDNVPHIKDAFKDVPKGTIIIGEIYYPGGTSKTVTTVMGCLADKAIERQQKKGLIHYYIYDVIKFEGNDLTEVGALDRYYKCKEIYDKYLSQYDFIELADIFTKNLAEKTVELLNSGEEGMVLKKKEFHYAPEKRPAWSTIKMKQHDTADVICLGTCSATRDYSGKLDLGINYSGEDAKQWDYWAIFKNDVFERFAPIGERIIAKGIDYKTIPVTKGYYYGWCTSIKIGAIDDNGEQVEIGTIASGIDDSLRADLATNPQKYIGSVLKVDCMSLDNSEHTIRHGIFKGFRDDKDAKDCKINDIFK